MFVCTLISMGCTASIIAERTGLRPSHASKVIGALEERGYLVRELGKQDKRQMYLSLTKEGQECLARIKAYGFEIPELLKPVFEGYN